MAIGTFHPLVYDPPVGLPALSVMDQTTSHETTRESIKGSFMVRSGALGMWDGANSIPPEIAEDCQEGLLSTRNFCHSHLVPMRPLKLEPLKSMDEMMPRGRTPQ